jgi:amino acid adenylation domain-containing protein
MIPRRADAGPAPLSFAQQQMWLHAQLAGGLPVYNEPVTVHRHGPLDVDALERSLAEVIARHEAWRTSFPVIDGQPVQMIHPPAPIALPVVDLRELPVSEREAQALEIATADALRPFDLGRGPLLRATLVRLGDEEHRLFVTLHHIIFDGVAMYQVFLPELTTLYAAFAAGQPSPLPAPPIQYADFATWQRQRTTGKDWDRHLEYWRRQLDGAPALDLRTDHPRPPVESLRGGMHSLAFGPELSAALRALSAKARVTIFMTMLAAFKTLLHRVTGQDDLTVGTVTAGRKRPELERLLGYFLNPVPLRTDLGGDPTFLTLLGRVRDVTLDALACDEIPFEHVVNSLRPTRDPGRHPLFQAAFSLEPTLPALPAGWAFTQLDVDTGTTKFDLYLELDDRPEGIIGRFMYRSDLFEDETIARMAARYRTLLDGVVADPDRPLSALPLLPPQERRLVLDAWQGVRADYPHIPIHRVFEAQAEATPDAVALIFEGREVTYGDVNRQANRLAHRLRALGVGPETLVGVAMERSPAMVESLLAILKAGSAYVPLDPAYPPDFFRFLLEDSKVSAVVTETRLRDRLPGAVPGVLCLDAESATIAGEPDTNPALPVEIDDLAYVMYTSGSTGRPKGVMIPHRGVLRLLFGQDYTRFDAKQTFLQLAPSGFDASTFELWGALLHGARCVLSPGGTPTPATLGALIREHGVTTLWLTTSLFNGVIDEAPDTLDGVRELLIGGEALSVPHVRRAFEHLPWIRIVNGYGPTESTTFTCCYPIPGPPDREAISIPIGSPIANTEVYVVDRHLTPLPIGVPGELLIGGAGLGRGYLARPELTAEKFVPDPFSGRPGARLYRTGDLVCWRPGGVIEFLGRLDEQVKVRGFRVEPGEIEAVLGQHPAVREVAVAARDATAGSGKALVAWVVPRGGQSVDAAALRGFLRDRLPTHMVPSMIVPMSGLPRTASGKTDRQALPVPGHDRTLSTPGFVAPRDPLEGQLAEIWESVLAIHPIGITDDFFDLGGHSLQAIRLTHQLATLYGVTLTPSALYTHSTVERLAAAIRRGEHGTFRAPMIQIKGGLRTPFFFFHGDLTGGGFYCLRLARRLEPDQPVYVVHPLGRDGRPMPTTIEAMAEAHLEAIRTVQPTGPYRLGGYCNGALVVYEMAQRLSAAGETVESLVLIAAAPDTRFAALHAGLDRLASGLRIPRERSLDWFARWRAALRDLRGLTPGQRLRFLLGKVIKHGPRLIGGTSAATGDTTFDRYFRAVMGYCPRPYAGRVVLFWPEDEPHGDDVEVRWRRLAPEIRIHRITGTHSTIVTNHAELIADRLGAYL